MRFANPVPLEKARQGFPAHFADWSPSGSEVASLRVRSGVSFPARDPLAPGGEPPEGELEEMLAAQPRRDAAASIPLLRASLLQVPSTTEPAPDGTGMTPLALNRPPVIWILAFTRLDLARRFADDAPFCLDFRGSDLIARLPHHFGLHLNFGAGSVCQIGPEHFRS